MRQHESSPLRDCIASGPPLANDRIIFQRALGGFESASSTLNSSRGDFDVRTGNVLAKRTAFLAISVAFLAKNAVEDSGFYGSFVISVAFLAISVAFLANSVVPDYQNCRIL